MQGLLLDHPHDESIFPNISWKFLLLPPAASCPVPMPLHKGLSVPGLPGEERCGSGSHLPCRRGSVSPGPLVHGATSSHQWSLCLGNCAFTLHGAEGVWCPIAEWDPAPHLGARVHSSESWCGAGASSLRMQDCPWTPVGPAWAGVSGSGTCSPLRSLASLAAASSISLPGHPHSEGMELGKRMGSLAGGKPRGWIGRAGSCL